MNLRSKIALKSFFPDDFSAIKTIYLIILSYLIFSIGLEYNSMPSNFQGNLFAQIIENAFPFVLIAWIAQISSSVTKQNRQLASEIEMLSRASDQNSKMATLEKIGQLFHACQSVEELLEIASERLRHIFPNTTGALYLMSDASDALERVMAWGATGNEEHSFSPNECWALRRGRAHHVKRREDSIACRHINVDDSDWHMCLPLTAHGEAVGVLVVSEQTEARDQISSDDWSSDDQTPFYTKFAEILGLAVANLRMREALHGQAIRDPLTQLFNRRYFVETLPRELNRVARSQEPLSLAVLDIDHFKQFNDTHGHDAGDAVLRAVAGVLKEQMRLEDIACRYGGEEFALVFPGMPADVMVRRMQTVRQQIEALELAHLGQSLDQITISAGIAVYPHDATEMDALVAAADQALYQSKRSGRNRATLALASQRIMESPQANPGHRSGAKPDQADPIEACEKVLRMADHRREEII